MKAREIVKYLLDEAEQSGVVKVTDKPTQSDYIEHYLYIAFCAILTLLLLV